MAPRENKSTYVLTGQEDTYAGQNAQNPATSRRVLSFLSSDDGQLYRELAEPVYLPTQLSGPIVSSYEFDWNDSNGNIVRNYFAAARTDFTPGTITCNLYQSNGEAWILVSDVGVLADAPMFVTLNNMMQLCDGVSNFLYDGKFFANVGIVMPYQGGYTAANQYTGAPFWIPAIDTTQSGSFSCTVGRYYWFTNADLTTSRPIHESSSSAPSIITGALSNKKVAVYQTPGLWSVTLGSKNITVAASSDSPGPVLPLNQVSPDGPSGLGPAIMSEAFEGKMLYIDGTTIGVIAGVGVSGGNNYLQLVSNSPATIVTGRAVIVDVRCTNWNIYASESDSSLVGQYLNLTIPVTQNLTTTPVYDQSPYISNSANTFVPIFRPVRNDPPPPSKILEVHKYRAFRVRSTKPNFFNFSANEEVFSGNNGNANECVPGATSSYAAGQAFQNTNTQKTAGTGANENEAHSVVSVTITNGGSYSDESDFPTVSFSGGGGSGAAGVPTFYSTGTKFKIFHVSGVTITNEGTGYTSVPTVTFSFGAAKGTAVLGGGTAWSNPTRVALSDGVSFATVLFPTGITATSEWLDATAFGFALGLTDQVAGQQVTITAKSSVGAGNNVTLILLKNGVKVGSSKTLLIKSLGTYSFGSATDLWGSTWTAANENSTTFGVAIQASSAPGSVSGSTVAIQNVQVNAYYEVPLPGGFQTLTNTLSDVVDEVSYPDQSNRIRGAKSYSDALYLASERQVYPLYGQSIDDFAFSQVAAFSVGLAGRFAWEATPHGLAFLSYDRKGLLYPTSATSPYFSVALHAQATENLVEFGKPMRRKFAQIDPQRLDEVVTKFYYYGVRNWFVIGYPVIGSDTWITYVYDFNTKAWFQLQQGFSSLSVFEISDGTLILVGGGRDGYMYVIDDQSGTYTSGANLPPATWRPALINFGGNDGSAHIAKFLELELTNNDMANDITVSFWLDPVDVDDPGTGRVAPAIKVQTGANRWRYWFTNDQAGTVCERLLVEVFAKPSLNAGAIRGAKLSADPAPGIPS